MTAGRMPAVVAWTGAKSRALFLHLLEFDLLVGSKKFRDARVALAHGLADFLNRFHLNLANVFDAVVQ